MQRLRSIVAASLLALGLAFGALPAMADTVADLTAAAEAGDVDAQTRLGNWYAHGIKVEKDRDKARAWFERAADQGDPLAAYELALMYEFGRSVEKNKAHAAYWFQKGAEGGHGPSVDKFARFKSYLTGERPLASTTSVAAMRFDEPKVLAPPPVAPVAPPPGAKPIVPPAAIARAEITLAALREQEPAPRPVAETAPAPRAEQAVQTAAAVPPKAAAILPVEIGRYHALVIGNNDYPTLTSLETAVNDAKAVSELLRDSYGYDVTLLLNATRYDVLKALTDLRNTLTEEDSLLLYYAGHGVVDRETDRGYWLPVDADPAVRANWLSNTDITDMLKAMQAWHVMVVADSCYSGALVRSVNPVTPAMARRADYYQRLLDKRSRTVLSSGGLEPVLDGGGGGHSVFTKAFLSVLRENQDVLEGSALFSLVRLKVVLNAYQTPEYADIRFAGHDGGDFLFIRK